MSAEEIESRLTPLLEGYDIRRAGIFGSYASGEHLPYILTFMDLCNASLIIFTSPSRFLP